MTLDYFGHEVQAEFTLAQSRYFDRDAPPEGAQVEDVEASICYCGKTRKIGMNEKILRAIEEELLASGSIS